MPVEDRSHIAEDRRFAARQAYHAEVRRVLGLHEHYDVSTLTKEQCFEARRLIGPGFFDALNDKALAQIGVERGDLQGESPVDQGELFGSGQ